MQNKSFPIIEWTSDEAIVFQRLTQHRQSTSVELIKHCGIQNPHGLIEAMNQKLAGSEWQIFCSVMRTADPKKIPVGYYRLLRKPLTV
nr:hypothetical protein [uncultured Deefgea sp.]